MTTIQIESGDWGNSSIEDIKAVVSSVAGVFERDASIRINDVVIVRHTPVPNPPRALIQRGANNEHVVLLTSRNRKWAQLSYQFAHEYCHVFTEHYRVPIHHRFRWFEESLCELASIYAITRMASIWQASPPYQHWKSYAGALQTYVEEHVANVSRYQSPRAFRDWLEPNLNSLSNNSEIREMNSIVAVQLLPIFLRHPKLWMASTRLNQSPILNGTFSEYLESWELALPAVTANLVRQLQDRLGYNSEEEP